MAKDPKGNKWIPNLSGRVDPITEQAILYLFQGLYALRDGNGFGPNAKEVLTKIIQPLTITQVAQTAQAALSAGGTHPLDITGLTGVTANPQPNTGPTVVTSLPPVGDPLSYIGNTVTYQGVEYQFRADPTGATPGQWVRTVSIGTVLQSSLASFRTAFPAASYPPGTQVNLSEGPSYIIQVIAGVNTWRYYSSYMADVIANIPGGLGTDDAGFTFSATDYIQQYQWNGSAWHFQTNSGSGYTQYFGGTGPTYGLWGAADGSTYATSQDNGTTANKVSPNLGAGYYFRR